MYIHLADIYQAYSKHRGTEVSTNDVKAIFKSKPCHRIFFFLVLQELGLINDIQGRGVAGDPYWVSIPA